MDSESFKDRLADAIEAEIPVDANRKAWLRGKALDLDISFSMLRKYHAGVHECPGSVLNRMYDLFGTAFEARVRGKPAESGDPIAQIEQAVEQLKGRNVVPLGEKLS